MFKMCIVKRKEGRTYKLECCVKQFYLRWMVTKNKAMSGENKGSEE